eukprot:5636681-Lingulodinium_polyedra.AAC.1
MRPLTANFAVPRLGPGSCSGSPCAASTIGRQTGLPQPVASRPPAKRSVTASCFSRTLHSTVVV